jgi:hypothetical protein
LRVHLRKEYRRVEKDSFHRLSSSSIPLILAKSFEQPGEHNTSGLGETDPETLLIVPFLVLLVYLLKAYVHKLITN